MFDDNKYEAFVFLPKTGDAAQRDLHFDKAKITK